MGLVWCSAVQWRCSLTLASKWYLVQFYTGRLTSAWPGRDMHKCSSTPSGTVRKMGLRGRNLLCPTHCSFSCPCPPPHYPLFSRFPDEEAHKAVVSMYLKARFCAVLTLFVQYKTQEITSYKKQRRFTAKLYPSEKKFYTDTIPASVTNSMSGPKSWPYLLVHVQQVPVNTVRSQVLQQTLHPCGCWAGTAQHWAMNTEHWALSTEHSQLKI